MGEATASDKLAEGHHLAGHIGNLTAEQERALEAFKEDLLKANLYTPAKDGEKASHDDATVLRFLRARSFNRAAAQKQFAEAAMWRKKHNVDNLYARIDPDAMRASQRYYPRWTGRRDKLGIPLHVYRLASLDPLQREIDAVPTEERYNRIVALYEYMTRFTFPLCSHLPHFSASTPISTTMTIIDLESVSFGSMWRLRNHLQEASKLATANYPETLHTIAIVNSPSFFPTIWNWIKGWFDEGTRQKIHVLGKDPGSTLLALVDSHNLPKSYGGELDWKFEDNPHLDEDTKQAIGDEIPKGPIAFVDGNVVQWKPEDT